MKKRLALDTSTEFLSLAVQTESGLFCLHEAVGAAASQRVLPEISRLLNEAGIALQDLDGIVYGTGPGAFTGVRVSVGVAQGLAFGAGLPVVGVSSLMAVAQSAWVATQADKVQADKVLVCLDARMGEVYHAALIRQADAWTWVSAPTVCKPDAVPVLAGEGWLAAGAGWGVFGEVLAAQYPQQIIAIHADLMPQATAMLSLAEPVFAAGHAQAAHEASPLYVRNRVALTATERAQGQTL